MSVFADSPSVWVCERTSASEDTSTEESYSMSACADTCTERVTVCLLVQTIALKELWCVYLCGQ